VAAAYENVTREVNSVQTLRRREHIAEVGFALEDGLRVRADDDDLEMPGTCEVHSRMDQPFPDSAATPRRKHLGVNECDHVRAGSAMKTELSEPLATALGNEGTVVFPFHSH
jgi:hypothetical protein